uniref:Uncharacterized protein n=1 Tax=Dikerogammarus haemobaphes virus 1 TaxID=2704946 RepID=A0A6G9HEF6_9VIRU|nr:hypothetical protein [Dikerogammarus haemobaphes virus 1]
MIPEAIGEMVNDDYYFTYNQLLGKDVVESFSHAVTRSVFEYNIERGVFLLYECSVAGKESYLPVEGLAMDTYPNKHTGSDVTPNKLVDLAFYSILHPTKKAREDDRETIVIECDDEDVVEPAPGRQFNPCNIH